MDKHTRHQLLSTIFSLRQGEYSKCFAPPGVCPNPTIRAHSVQNAQVLDLLAVNGHLVAPTVRMDGRSGVSLEFARIGRNRATTFAGLCADHDRDLFLRIETAPIDPEDPEHAFLLSYRAVLYELHATCAAATMLQLGYQKRVNLGLDPREQPSQAGMYATERMIVSYETFMYKLAFDAAYAKRDFSCLSHDLVPLSVARPTIAASALFSMDHLQRGDDTVRATLTVLPLAKDRTVALFSYLNEDAELARSELANILTAKEGEVLRPLSVRLLNNCQNFVVAPDYFAGWSPEKLASITTFFTQTLMHDDLDNPSPHLQLFAAVA